MDVLAHHSGDLEEVVFECSSLSSGQGNDLLKINLRVLTCSLG
jgi:hypothetical protein